MFDWVLNRSNRFQTQSCTHFMSGSISEWSLNRIQLRNKQQQVHSHTRAAFQQKRRKLFSSSCCADASARSDVLCVCVRYKVALIRLLRASAVLCDRRAQVKHARSCDLASSAAVDQGFAGQSWRLANSSLHTLTALVCVQSCAKVEGEGGRVGGGWRKSRPTQSYSGVL